MSTDKYDNDLSFINNLFESLGDSCDMSTDDIKEELHADGVEPDETLQRLMSVVTQASADSRKSALDRAREKRLKEQDRVKKTIGKFKNWGREQLLDRIRILSGEHGLQAVASYRALGEQTEDNLRALLEDLEMLQKQNSTDSGDD